MKGGFRQSMAWLHTWTGLVLGWLLFAVFLTGTASYFRNEITGWMQPELHRVAVYSHPEKHAFAKLQDVAPSADRWFIHPPHDRAPLLAAAWLDNARTPRFESYALDPATGEALDMRATYGGDFFYRFHFELLMRPGGGRWIVGAAAMIMLVAIVTGVITHRRIFRDFFTFRPRKGGQRGWLDAHNVLAVLALPFHLMITYTGLITFMTMYMPWGVDAIYDGDVSAFLAEARGSSRPGGAAGVQAPLAPIDGMLEKARALWPGGRIGWITVDHPGDAKATVTVARHEGDRLSKVAEQIVFRGATGEIENVSRPDRPAIVTYGAAYGLHLARFADPPLRWLFFVSGLAGTAMVAAGLVLWTVKRRPRCGKAPLGHRIVEILNIGVIAGLPLAVAVYFWSNRLLPVDMAARADWEIRCLLLAWLAAALYPSFRPARRAWIEQLGLAALLFLLLPVLNALTTGRHLLDAIPRGDWTMAGFDMTTAGIGLAFASSAWLMMRRRDPVPVHATIPKDAMPGAETTE
jgi:uncharacterized iron-regulated membrane protein